MARMRKESGDLPDLDEELRRFLEERLAAPSAFIQGLEAGDPSAAVGPEMKGPDGMEPSPSTSQPATDSSTASGRYAFESELAAGGSGRILHVFDRDIGRRVAMKVLRMDRSTERTRARFIEESQATGQLEHPNIPPVYDAGVHSEYGAFFTMRLVQGRTLREILRDLSVGRMETLKHFTLTRLIQVLQGVAMGIHYAHSRGVIHRDLKPENIMVGDFGEVLVLDWGVAKISSRRIDSSVLRNPVHISSAEREAGEEEEGSVSGTLSHMSPEQARGWIDDIDERTDVFGLGSILYEVLTFHPPYEGKNLQEVLTRAGACQVVRPRDRAPRNEIPPSLEEICMRALSAAKDDRYPSAVAFHEALQVFLDGTLEAERRQKEAAQLVLEARDLSRAYRRLTEEEARLRAAAQKQLEAFAPHDPADLKAEAWRGLDEAAARGQERAQAFSDATALLHSAINIDGTCRAAKEALAELYWRRFEEAEQAGAFQEMAIYRRLVERYHEGRFAALLEDKGLVTVVSNPPGARVSLRRIVERSRRFVEEEEQACGVTPLKVDLAVGQYVVVLRKEGRRDTRLPIQVQRCDKQLARVNLYRDEEIGAGFIHIPQGETIAGGDAGAPGSLPLERRYVADFFIAELPVTFREYCRFLDDLHAAGDPDLERWIPRAEIEGPIVQRGPGGGHEPSRHALDIEPDTRALYPGSGEEFEWNLPVLALSWHAAERYAKWLASRTGRPIRLLRDVEWEKSARGVAGWAYPWGSHFDWSLVKGGLSRPGRAQPEPVGAFPTDRSVYGVRDLSGTIREWCRDWFLEGQYRLTRGGSWFNIHEGAFRAAHRLGTRPDNQSSVIGFRVGADPPEARA